VKLVCWTAASLSFFAAATLVAGCGAVSVGSKTAQGSSGTGSGTGSGGSGGGGAPGNVPSNAVVVSALQALPTWNAAYDTGTSGSSVDAGGTMALVNAPSLSGQAREFASTYTNSGGERYYVSFGQDTASTHFLYDAWVYLDGSAGDVANLEMDMNQVMANGQTVIYGFQCDGYSKTWDYTANGGTPQTYVDQWVKSGAPCDLQSWSRDTWHHVQIAYSRDSAGNVTYESVWLDDVEQDIDATVPSSFALGWSSTLLTNLQVDGMGASGSSTVWMDDLTVYRW